MEDRLCDHQYFGADCKGCMGCYTEENAWSTSETKYIAGLEFSQRLSFLYQPSSIDSLLPEHKSDYLKVKAALDNENSGLEPLKTYYKHDMDQSKQMKILIQYAKLG